LESCPYSYASPIKVNHSRSRFECLFSSTPLPWYTCAHFLENWAGDTTATLSTGTRVASEPPPPLRNLHHAIRTRVHFADNDVVQILRARRVSAGAAPSPRSIPRPLPLSLLRRGRTSATTPDRGRRRTLARYPLLRCRCRCYRCRLRLRCAPDAPRHRAAPPAAAIADYDDNPGPASPAPAAGAYTRPLVSST